MCFNSEARTLPVTDFMPCCSTSVLPLKWHRTQRFRDSREWFPSSRSSTAPRANALCPSAERSTPGGRETAPGGRWSRRWVMDCAPPPSSGPDPNFLPRSHASCYRFFSSWLSAFWFVEIFYGNISHRLYDFVLRPSRSCFRYALMLKARFRFHDWLHGGPGLSLVLGVSSVLPNFPVYL